MKAGFRKTIALSCFSAAMMCTAQVASAATWNIVAVLNGGGGFGASSFHDASGTYPQSGGSVTEINEIAGAFGTYVDDTGLFSATDLQVLAGPLSPMVDQTFSLNGTLKFGGMSSEFGALEADSTLVADFGTDPGLTPVGSTTPDPTFTLGFMDTIICCGFDPEDPNSFVEIMGNMAIMTLWGADGFAPTASQKIHKNYDGSRFGMDLRLKLVKQPPGGNPPTIPLPAAFPLFAGAVGLMGLLGWRRRNSNTSA